MKLSISMIVKNESSCIEKCLESVKEADEIIIVDTGSTDNTIELCKKYTDKVYSGEEYSWRDDFSFSRNQSLDKCTGDWVYIIDADEFLEPEGIKKIRKIIDNPEERRTAFLVKCYDDVYQNIFSLHSLRLFKRQYSKGDKIVNVRWHQPVHNYLSISTGEIAEIKHYIGYSKAHEKDPDREFRILKKYVTENPNCGREKFYLARAYGYKKDWKESLKIYKSYIETTKNNISNGPEYAEAHLMAAGCCINLNRYKDARKFALDAIDLNANSKSAAYLMAKLTGPGNSKRWTEIGDTATDEGTLFAHFSENNKKNFILNIVNVDGFKFNITNPKEHIQSFLNYGVYYEENMIKYIQKNYNGGVFVDIGACIGTHTLPFSRIADIVYSFEPDFENYYNLLMNIKLNNLANLNPFNIAIGEDNYIAKFLINPDNIGMHKIDESGPFEIPVMKLDIFKLEKVKLIKIDAANYGMKILKGAANTIYRNLPDIFIECQTDKIKEEITKYLKTIDKRYEAIQSFNITPTWLFSINEVE